MTSKHILIVDDEPRVAYFLSKALEHSNRDYRVSIAHSGEEALDVLNRSTVDLLVTDLRMPGISGLELIRWVRASSPQTRTILITAYGNDEVEEEARRLEAYSYITKPFSLEDFTQAAQGALRDMAVSQPGLVVLSDESFEAIALELESLRDDVGARCILLADMLGQRLAEVGVTKGINTPTLLSLLAGGFATSGELARHFGSGQAINLNFHEGTRYEIYSANVGDNLFLAMLYERQSQASRIGLVWLYTRRAIERLLSILSTTQAAAPAQSLSTDFGSSLMTELDTLFPGPHSQPESHPRRADDRIRATDTGRFSPTVPSEPALSEVEGTSPSSPPVMVEAKHADGSESEKELLDMDDAIARGLIPPNLGAG
jgi:CheY-like chemotaxis protein